MPAVFLSVFLSACQSGADYSSALVTKQGVKAESLMPADALMVIKLGTSDLDQIGKLNEMMAVFPQDGMKTVKDELISSFDEGLGDSKMSFVADILPVIGVNPQMILSISGNIAEDSDPDVVAVVQVEDGQKAKAILDKSLGNGFEKQMYKSFDVYVENSSRVYIVLYKDVLLIANRIALIQKGIDGASMSSGTLLQDPSYQKGINKIKSTLGFFYFDVEGYLKNYEGMKDNPVMTGLEAEMMGVKAEEGGLSVRFIVYGDEKKLRESKFNIIGAQTETAYLYKEINPEGLVLYFEGYGLGNLIRMESEAYKNLEGFDQLSEGVTSMFAGVGIDAEKDLKAFMDKGFAFVLADNGSSVPVVSMLWDVSADSAGAKRIAGIIYDSIEKFLVSLDEEVKKSITHQKKDESGEPGYVLTLDLKALNGGEVNGASPASLIFAYGVDAGDLFYAGLNYNGFGLNSGIKQGLEGDEEFLKAKSNIAGYDRGLMYFSMANILVYADRIVDDTVKNGAMSEDDRQVYNHVKGFLSHIKSVIFSGAKATTDSVETRGFIRIE